MGSKGIGEIGIVGHHRGHCQCRPPRYRPADTRPSCHPRQAVGRPAALPWKITRVEPGRSTRSAGARPRNLSASLLQVVAAGRGKAGPLAQEAAPTRALSGNHLPAVRADPTAADGSRPVRRPPSPAQPQSCRQSLAEAEFGGGGLPSRPPGRRGHLPGRRGRQPSDSALGSWSGPERSPGVTCLSQPPVHRVTEF
jgi:hypothetical protein